ncbi:MAG: glycosyltransferase family 9 protein [bacterium]|nr:glycosyltransferase family 9 protein [bacterium]
MSGRRLLIVRLGSMGDVIHTLPAAATLKHSFPNSFLAWVVDPKWAPLLDGNPFLDEVICLDRKRLRNVLSARRRLRQLRFDTAVDFQGLVKSAFVTSLARPDRIYGFHQSQARESLAALFYSTRVRATASHVVDKNLELASAAGASNVVRSFSVPSGKPEGPLPAEPFVLASPLGGWRGKQWPLERYGELARLLKQSGLALVLDGPPAAAEQIGSVQEAFPHYSSLNGLMAATSRAAAVVGIDSGPMHLAAAMGKPGVAIFGPTDPARNGPSGDSFTLLRDGGATTTYKRRQDIDPGMRAISAQQVFDALMARLG